MATTYNIMIRDMRNDIVSVTADRFTVSRGLLSLWNEHSEYAFPEGAVLIAAFAPGCWVGITQEAV